MICVYGISSFNATPSPLSDCQVPNIQRIRFSSQPPPPRSPRPAPPIIAFFLLSIPYILSPPPPPPTPTPLLQFQFQLHLPLSPFTSTPWTNTPLQTMTLSLLSISTLPTVPTTAAAIAPPKFLTASMTHLRTMTSAHPPLPPPPLHLTVSRTLVDVLTT